MGSLGKGWVGSQTIGKNNRKEGEEERNILVSRRKRRGGEDMSLEGREEHRMSRTHWLGLLAMMSGYCISQDGM